MRYLTVILATSVLWAQPSLAAEALKFGPRPSWVVDTRPGLAKPELSGAPLAILLNDQQVHFEPGKVSVYNEIVIKIQNDQGLTAGNVSLPWQPATDTVTVNKLVIRRGNQLIDVLASGQTFTTVRRETNLDAATLDGQLTANIQPEGLQEGDILELATTMERSDPVLRGHVESMFVANAGVPIAVGHTRLTWPDSVKLKTRISDLLPKPKATKENGRNILVLRTEDVEAPTLPKGAPPRYGLGLFSEASDFTSWAEVADLAGPLFQQASLIPATGPLRAEVDRIRVEGGLPKARAEMALALVQKRIRYVALLMGSGNYKPASAEDTWSRRYGDCKGKTALLLGLLRELGIAARPVLVHSSLGDALPQRLPMIGAFDHVIVEAVIDGRSYFLDGTRTGDNKLDEIESPYFAWGLPVTQNASLVRILPTALTRPATETIADIDAGEGAHAPAPTTVVVSLRGMDAAQLNAFLSMASGKQRDEFLRSYWKSTFGFVAVTATNSEFEASTGELRMTMSGTAKIDWDGGFRIPGSTLAFKADFKRPPGPTQDAPIGVGYPAYSLSRTTMRMPAGFFAGKSMSVGPVSETLAGVEYRRTATLAGDALTVETSERSIAPEIPYADALKAEPRLRTLWDEDVLLRLPVSYQATKKDLAALGAEQPRSAGDYLDRGIIYLDEGKFDEAIADFTEAHKLDSKGVWPLANRALAYAWKRDIKSAERDIAAADAIQADNRIALRARGMAAETKGDFAGALAAYDKILARNSNDNWTRLRRAAVRQQLGKRDDALRDIDAVIAADPRHASALAQRAYILAEMEDWKAAEATVATALASDPANSQALTVKAMIALQRKNYKTAIEFATEALNRNPDNEFARNLRAQLLKRESGEKGSMQAFDEAVALSSSDPAALLARAFAYLEAKDFKAAEKDITAARALAPLDLRTLQARAALAMAKGDYQAAVEATTAALKTYPANGPLLVQRAEAYRQKRDFDLALADTDEALKAGLESASVRLLRTNILVQKGDLAAAAAEADRLVQENPTSEYAMVAAGKAYSFIGMREKAMASFDRAIAINPVPYIYLNRSQVRPFGDVEAKFADLDAALKIDPDYEEILSEKARLLSRAGRHAEAIALYDRAIKAAFDGSYLQLGWAIALERSGRSIEARKVFEAEKSRAKTADDFNNLCWRKATNDVVLQSALADCREALRLDPRHKSIHESLGMVQLKLGQLSEALTAYDKAIATKGGATAYMGRAIVRARLGDTAGGRADAAEARKLRPYVDDAFAEMGLKPEAELGLASR